DGGLSAGDMNFGNLNWHSILVGSLGAGGKGLFALDISNPDLTNQSSTAINDTKVLWELDGSNPDIGYIYDKSEIAKLSDGNWYVITGNGYGSTNATASLLLISSSGVVTTIEADNAVTTNGLSRPTLIDTNGDGAVDFAYAGDLQGNLYRFDLNTKTKADKLFSAGSNKPITTAPKITNHPIGGRIVLFGTGSLLSETDVNDISIQSVYGIRDFDTATFISSTNLVSQTLSPDFTYTNPDTARIVTLRTIVNPLLPVDWVSKDGWKVDLPAGERVVLDPNLRAARFQVMSINPVSKEAWLIQLDYYDGTVRNIYYDLNEDNIFDATDTVNFKVDVTGKQLAPGDIPVAIKQGTGSFSRQLIARVTNGIDANFINGLTLPIIKTCESNCTSGFVGGHIDVDTDSPSGGSSASNIIDRYCYVTGDRSAGIPVDAAGIAIPPSTNSPFQRLGGIPAGNAKSQDGLSGGTDGHQHEYDKAHGTVEIDYLNLESYCKQNRADDNTRATKLKLNRVTEVGIGNSTEFFVIIANADLSPGSELNIGNESWSVVVYQKLIQQKLDAWKAAGAVPTDFRSMMVDNNSGKSLIYTLDQILTTVNAGTGKFTNSFNDRAIIDGGLHPTQTSCVNKSSSITNGRWRNGALITQLIDVNNYILNPSTVVKQKPGDLKLKVPVYGVDIYLKEAGVIYGGLYADNAGSSTGIGVKNKAFLFESTLFWHFGTLYELNFGLKPCYGDAQWAKARAFEIAGITPAQLAIYVNDPTTALGKAKQKLDNAIATGDQIKIDQAQKDYNTEYNKLADYVKRPGTGDNLNQPTTITRPVITQDSSKIGTIGNTNLDFGRRAWIDIRP
ncbi:MAG: pilus assembly protein, partial [Thiohalomonadales bacterium]